MKLKNLLFLLLSLFASVAAMTSCDSSDDEQKKIELGDGQQTAVSYGAKRTSGEVRFATSASWSAWTAASHDGGPADIGWLSLDTRRGAAGESVVTFTMEPNTTGSPRTAYIVIVCEDTKIVITITQTAGDDDGDDDEALPVPNIGRVEAVCTSYYSMGGGAFSAGYITRSVVNFENGRPASTYSSWRDDLNNSSYNDTRDSYCESMEKNIFTWGNGNVTISGGITSTYYPSGTVRTEEESVHHAKYDGTRVTSGNYKWDDDSEASEWTASYDALGYLKATKNNDGTTTWDTYNFTWENGNLKKISADNGGVITFTYSDPSLLNLHGGFDLNWVLPQNLEYYDFAAGDITRHFVACGLMGKPSKNLVTEITENDGHRTWSCRMTYKENSAERTVVTVACFVDGVQSSYSDWEIHYTGME
ncbi:MAG: hypothetical protein NC344_08120 [Bacteroidales bacterium]|nr:hypothetical protein [Bacteroidales bacterium]MCM1147780.1 hypothetical protein [Bacteroidales bacterium]MCM1206610.1 hypothetical protein [Bacillota bacterium]MCM1510649.1 hypothetical protein [Clostridium sp.]